MVSVFLFFASRSTQLPFKKGASEKRRKQIETALKRVSKRGETQKVGSPFLIFLARSMLRPFLK